MWRVFKEGTGVGVQQRLAQVILGDPVPRATWKASIPQQFLCSASASVSRFGPAWAKREIAGRPVGVWCLLFFCLVMPAMLAMLVI